MAHASVWAVALLCASSLALASGSEVRGSKNLNRVREPSSVRENCATQKEFLKKAYRDRTSFDSVLVQALHPRHQLIMIGDSHDDRASAFYSWFIAEAKRRSPRLDCVLVEQPTDQYDELFKACTRARNKDGCVRGKLPIFAGIQPAIKEGLKLYAVDAVAQSADPFGGFSGQKKTPAPNFLDDVSARNRHMATAARRLIASGSCRQAIMIVGGLHLHKDPRVTSLASLVQDDGIGAYRIELVNPAVNTRGLSDAEWSWHESDGKSVCGESPGIVRENFAFELKNSQSLAAQAPMFYGAFSEAGTDRFEFVGRWSDFDAALLLGCTDPKAKACPVPGEAATGYLRQTK